MHDEPMTLEQWCDTKEAGDIWEVVVCADKGSNIQNAALRLFAKIVWERSALQQQYVDHDHAAEMERLKT